MLQWMVCVFADDDSSWNFYALNYYLGFGVFGRILASMCLSGYGLVFVHVCVFSFFEWKAKLTPLTDLRDMFSRLNNPSQEEVKQFTFFLRIMPYIGLLSIFGITVPMTFLNVVGAVVTGYRFHGMMFVLYCSPLLVIFSVVLYFSGSIWLHVQLIIAQSTMYFKIRLNRVEKNLKEIANQSSDQSLSPERRQSVGNQKSKHKKTPRRHVFIDDVVLDLQQTLDELNQHNLLIKHFLRDQLYGMAGVFITMLVFVLGPHEWYYRRSS